MEAVRSHFVAGMPALSYTGLSENWLWKTCGDRHWQQLAAIAGQVVPDFRDAEGHRAYAAFTAIRIREAALEAIGENDAFTIDSFLSAAGGAKYLSEHVLVAHGARRARVTMLSTFVRRTRERDNRSVVRAMPMPMPMAMGKGTATPQAADGLQLSTLARCFRGGNWDAHLGLDQTRHATSHAIEFLPCPYMDFNGADLLYFASFQAMVDRAEWHWRTDSEPPVVCERDLFFHGNVNVGEALELNFAAARADDAELGHWCEIRRARDGEKIADVVTRKRWRQR
ncbi:probable biosynthetic protein, Pnap_2097 family [Cupriavidus sp. YR651]|uniref:Pnap_2097 family protein n=1 Tax=Cupriavidus sp. YR651 TaxID=1855315 RepID=UPI000880FCCB|nr:Pnap_2097 family protein [Cupriavidus sp. YR651]SDD55961.1 probable biosynthetic protein, Pnap_2097 family [Cupriavidus sp. YR651]